MEATAEAPEEVAEDGDEDAAAKEAEVKDPNQEERGSGVNKYTYFVTTNLFSPWKRLPDVGPGQIAAARKIQLLFSGDLERDIVCNPFFFGKEKHLLRAQIARITHSTTLVPKGQYKLNEENEREIEEFEPEEDSKVEPLPSTRQASKPDAWVHFNASILKNNRTVHLDPPEEAPEGFDGEYDPEEAKKQIEAADPFEPRLKSITLDRKIKMGGKLVQSPWVVRLVGDSQEYVDERGKACCHGVVVVRSLIWPGAYTIYANRKLKSVYVGEGCKFSDELRPFPLAPPSLNVDPVEYGEFVLPVVKVITKEMIKEAFAKNYDNLWDTVHRGKDNGLTVETIKKLAGELKAKIHEKEDAMEVAEEAFDAAFENAEKDEDDKVAKAAAQTILIALFEASKL